VQGQLSFLQRWPNAEKAMLSESELIYERYKLFELVRKHPEWSLRAYAREVQHDPKWVRKWAKRLAGIEVVTDATLRSQSRRPKHSPRQLGERVKDKISELRETLSERFHRPAGAKLIAYFLGQTSDLEAEAPSLSSIYQTLLERGYIRARPKPQHTPLVLPAPNEEWELDFGEIYLGPVEGSLEFMLVVDKGTSRAIYIEGSAGYRAESAIDAVLRLFAAHGLPKRLRFDRDPRLWGSWTRDSYPAPFLRLLHALGVEPIAFDWYRSFIQGLLDSGSYVWFAKFVAVGETLVGIALIVGLFVGIAAFAGAFMNWSFVMAGTASTNGLLFAVAILLMLAWKTAGYYGLDRFVLPRLGTPWRTGSQDAPPVNLTRPAVDSA